MRTDGGVDQPGSAGSLGNGNDGSETGDDSTTEAELRQQIQELRAERDGERERADRLESVVEDVTDVMDGALSGDLTGRVQRSGDDAAATLASTTNELLSEWSSSIERVREFGDQVEGATGQVASTAETLREQSTTVSDSVGDISEDAERQHERIEEMTGEAESLSATIEEVASSADEVAAAAEDLSERSQSGSEAASDALSELESIEERTEATVESVESLVESVGDIETIVDTIDDIARQTHILALNASIEASRAGSAGDGFAVVADEVKQLAGETQDALEDIEAAIGEVRTEVDEASGEMYRTRDQVAEGRETIDEALSALEAIAREVESVSGQVAEISHSTESQAESTQQVASMADEVDEISEETAENAQAVAAAARQQTTALTEVQTAVTTLDERTETLSESIQRYRTESSARTTTGTTLEFWHAMSGQKAMLLERLAREFEDEYDGDVAVDLTAKGSYRGTLNATLNAIENDRPPAVAQIFEIGTKRAMDSGGFVPVEEVLPRSFDTDDLLDPVRSYYRTDGQLYSLPFNSSTPVFCYNRTAFERAGLDSERPPGTFEAVRAAAEAIVDSGVAPAGITFANYAWFVEQWFAEDGQELVDRRNGRDGDATAAYFDSGTGHRVFEWWTDMESAGLYHNPGIEARGEARSAFYDGEAAMLIASSSSLAAIQENAAAAGFDLGTGPLPVAGERNGVVVGGASLWVPEAVPDERREVAGAFLAWLGAPDQQARWHRETGYFPIRHDAVAALRSEGWFGENQHFETAIDQLLASSETPATTGARIGPFDSVRTIVEECYLDALEGSVAPALADCNDQVERLLADYGE